jgi:hypothetical protein
VNIVIALLVHGLAYAVVAGVITAPLVKPQAWLALYVLGAIGLGIAQLRRVQPVKASSWAQLLVYSSFFAALFAGASFALYALGNSVKSRSELPDFVGGLPLCLALFPGVATVALGGLFGALLDSKCQLPIPFARSPRNRQCSEA